METDDEAADRMTVIPTPASAPADLPAQRVSIQLDPLTEMHTLLERVEAWAERSDLKATILITAVTAAAAAEVAAIAELTGWAQDGPSARWFAVALLLASLGVLVVAGVLAAVSIYPRLEPGMERGGQSIERGDLIYFGRLRMIPAQEIKTGIDEAIDDGTLIDHYAQQLQHNSNVVWSKLLQLQRSLKTFAIAVGLAALAFVSWMAANLAD